MTFLAWCKLQRDRRDAIGDFARDWVADRERPRAPRLGAMYQYLYDVGAVAEAIAAAIAAYREWLFEDLPAP